MKVPMNNYFDEKYADEYEKWNENPYLAYLERRQKRCVTILSESNKDDRILDVGCGVGKYLVLMAERCDFIVGIDFSQKMLEKAKIMIKKRGYENKIHLVRGDASRLPFKASVFDEVICVNTVQYLENDVITFKQFKEVCKNGGNIILDGLCLTELRMGYPIVYLRNYMRKKRGKKLIGPYTNYYTHGSFQRRIRESGLKPVRILGCGIDPPYFGKDYIGIAIPSPHHVIYYLFPRAYKILEWIDEKIQEVKLLKNLGTHIFVKAQVRKKYNKRG
jgi:ubiquinone/menaquinone biosynthesis C-methylase UbiE